MDAGGNEGIGSEVQVVQQSDLTAGNLTAMSHLDKGDSSDSGAEDTGTSSSETPSKEDGKQTPNPEAEDDVENQELPVVQLEDHLASQLEDRDIEHSEEHPAEEPV